MKNNYDWRRNIKDINDLNDIDPLDIFVVMRHNFLECAKDLYRDCSAPPDADIGEEALLLSEQCQQAIDFMCGQDLTWLSPSNTKLG